MNKLFRHGLILLLLATLIGCGSTLKQTQTGFLGDYSQLAPASDYNNTQIWKANNFDHNSFAQIDTIALVPFEIWVDLNQQRQTQDGVRIIGAANASGMVKMVQYLHQQLEQKLSPHFTVITTREPVKGDNTLIIRGALTDIQMSEPELSPTDFIPFRMVLNAGNTAYLAATNQQDVVTEVSIEAEFLSGDSLQRVFAMTASKELETTVKQNGEENVQAVKAALDIWVENFVNAVTSKH